MTAESETRIRVGWWSDDSTGPFGGTRGRKWVLIASVFLAPYFIPVAGDLAAGGPVGASEAAGLAVLAAYGLCYMVFPWFVSRRGHAIRLAYGLVALGLGWTLLEGFDTGSVYGLLYAMIPIAMALPLGWMLVLNGGTIAALAVLKLSGAGYPFAYGDLWAMAGITTTLFFVVRLVRTVRRLREANATIAHLAVGAERERLARDLHDILGHSLTTITVKAGAARRLLEAGRDPARAAEEIGDVETLSRSALADVRATVSDYREVSLAAELVGARAALRAADIEADLPRAVDDVDPAWHGLFGYVVREATTNAIRHSGAKRVSVRVGPAWIEVENDGPAAEPAAPGNGLRGLAERAAPYEGTLEAGPLPGGGFKVRVEVP